MLPAQVKIILLSATVPNTLEFADWIGWVSSLPYPSVEWDLFIKVNSFTYLTNNVEIQTIKQAIDVFKGAFEWPYSDLRIRTFT